MAVNAGVYTITPVNQGTSFPVGVGPALLSSQNVIVSGVVQQWRVSPVGNGVYTLGVGGYAFIGIDDSGNVLATINPEENMQWRLTPSQVPNAYTIVQASSSLAWTVPDSLDDGANVSIRPIGGSGPFNVPPTQLFVFKSVMD